MHPSLPKPSALPPVLKPHLHASRRQAKLCCKCFSAFFLGQLIAPKLVEQPCELGLCELAALAGAKNIRSLRNREVRLWQIP
eukprot:Transcript_28924.p7 GENE.Transcript_28924~~Transcript_28924.p7  ORF type:complete len:82 (-),score=9.33 Transcript_28924:370-615(-)